MTATRMSLVFAALTWTVMAAALAAPADAAEVEFAHRAPGAKAVYLAGSFNDWDPAARPMSDEDGDGTWTAVVELAPGTHQYKFVVDGDWHADPGNPTGVDDGFGGRNSVVEVAAGADRIVAGGETAATAGPAAQAVRPGGGADGKVDVTFSHAPGGKPGSVHLAGEFNDWNAERDTMSDPDGDGVYTATLALAPGSYQYKYVVDGQWHQDPANPASQPDGFGGQNSVVEVEAGRASMTVGAAAQDGGGGQGTADPDPGPPGPGAAADIGQGLRSVEIRYTPVISGVTDVFLAGTFNDWNPGHTRMSDPDRDGTYTATLLLSPGTYQYKFVVDGQWHPDPNNPAGADDGFGGQNSVLTVDASYDAVEIETGDGRIYGDDLEPIFDYSTCNPISPTDIVLTARAHIDDVEGVTAVYRVDGGTWRESAMRPVERDPVHQYWRTELALPDAEATLEYVVRYSDADARAFLGAGGMAAARDETAPFVYTAAAHPPFLTPEWAKDGVIYQIFPERFRNGDTANDPDFSEPWYQGVTELPPSGKTNGEYFHLVDDWYDVAGLQRSPYRTDGRPDYYSFYGGDIAGIHGKLDYLTDLGVTVIYFNPLNQGMSNHKYDPVDYLTIDPHFATEDEFKRFVSDCHEHGIRIIVDMAFNHTGNWHFAFRDAVEKGRQSEYWNWYEFHDWPLPATRDFEASRYYDCWWGFGLHPNLNYDLARPNADENHIEDAAQANVNQPVVDYVLSVADYWLGELDIDGFRLDVPNEVPFWFWKAFRERCSAIKPDAYLVGELWGNAGRWIGPDCFDATMNYKFFRDPVMDFFGQGRIDAASFDRVLGPGRFQYPPQAVAVMMNLIDSHDTVRFLTTTGDVRRLMLAALFSMTYVGMPTIWYGDEVGMTGDKDPDCRRPFDWRYIGDPRKRALRDYYGHITRLRRDTPVLRRGDFTTLHAAGSAYAFARAHEGWVAVALFNAGPAATEVTLPAADLARLFGSTDGESGLVCAVGPERFPQAGDTELREGTELTIDGGDIVVPLPGMSGAVLLSR
ncbi:MAG: alpha-amylase family glycosyl hydrolase [Candidatus Krumholzibacteriia bacterium]